MRTVVIFLFFQLSLGMLIPEEAETLEGFGADFFPETFADDDYFETKSMGLGPLHHSMRNKRATNQQETKGKLISDSHPNTLQRTLARQSSHHPLRRLAQWWRHKLSCSSCSSFSSSSSSSSADTSSSSGSSSISSGSNYADNNIIFIPNRHRRSTNAEKAKPDRQSENIPSPSKLTKDSNGFASNRNGPSAAPLVGKFTRSPFEYSKVQHEEDSIALDTMDTSPISMNDGMKSRTPRVNFVTQQKKSFDHDDSKASATKSDFHKTPPLLHNSKELPTSMSNNERYSDKSSTTRPIDSYSNQKDQGLTANRYDDRYIEDMYPPPPPPQPFDMYDDFSGPYDPYMRRFSSYVDYPGNRYLQDYRDYPPIYDNEIDSRYYMRSDMMPPPPLPASSTLPRKRTIYYAYLPEIVRSPPTVDLRYRSYDRYNSHYNDFPNYETNSIVRNAYRHIKPNRQSISERDYRTARPMNFHNDDMVRNNTSMKEKKIDVDRFSNENRPIQPYSYRRFREYDPYLY